MYSAVCLWGSSWFPLVDMGRPTLNVSDTIPWVGVPDWVTTGQKVEHKRSPLFASWLWLQCNTINCLGSVFLRLLCCQPLSSLLRLLKWQDQCGSESVPSTESLAIALRSFIFLSWEHPPQLSLAMKVLKGWLYPPYWSPSPAVTFSWPLQEDKLNASPAFRSLCFLTVDAAFPAVSSSCSVNYPA